MVICLLKFKMSRPLMINKQTYTPNEVNRNFTYGCIREVVSQGKLKGKIFQANLLYTFVCLNFVYENNSEIYAQFKNNYSG